MAKENLPTESVFSFWSGVFLPVEYKGHSIVAHNSSWTSRMTIWVDGEVVYSLSSWKFTVSYTHLTLPTITGV